MLNFAELVWDLEVRDGFCTPSGLFAGALPCKPDMEVMDVPAGQLTKLVLAVYCSKAAALVCSATMNAIQGFYYTQAISEDVFHSPQKMK
eukprot:scaffold25131_cov18-Tisochrysis_lutea.AAC.2